MVKQWWNPRVKAWSLRISKVFTPWLVSFPSLDPGIFWIPAGVASGQCARGFGAHPGLRLGRLKRSGHRRHWLGGILPCSWGKQKFTIVYPCDLVQSESWPEDPLIEKHQPIGRSMSGKSLGNTAATQQRNAMCLAPLHHYTIKTYENTRGSDPRGGSWGTQCRKQHMFHGNFRPNPLKFIGHARCIGVPRVVSKTLKKHFVFFFLPLCAHVPLILYIN